MDSEFFKGLNLTKKNNQALKALDNVISKNISTKMMTRCQHMYLQELIGRHPVTQVMIHNIITDLQHLPT